MRETQNDHKLHNIYHLLSYRVTTLSSFHIISNLCRSRSGVLFGDVIDKDKCELFPSSNFAEYSDEYETGR